MKNQKNKHQTDNRIKCPFCSEKIQPDAKKCRFCGEWLIKTNDKKRNETPFYSKRISYVTYFWTWVVSLIIFLSIMVLFDFSSNKTPEYLTWILLSDVGIGGIAFLGLFLELVQGLFNSVGRNKVIKYSFISVILCVLFFLALTQISAKNEEKRKKVSPDTSSNTVNQVFNCPQGQVACKYETEYECLTPEVCQSKISLKKTDKTPTTPITQKSVNTSGDTPVHCQVDSRCGGGTTPLKKSECDIAECCLVNGSYKFTKDPNECQETIIKCNIHPDCGGGYKEMKRIDCSNLTCCQINGTWELRSKDTCKQEQSDEAAKSWIDYCNTVYKNSATGEYYDGYINCLNQTP